MQVVSVPNYYLKTMSLQKLLEAGKPNGTHIPKTEEGMIAQIQLLGQLAITSS